MTRTNLDTKFLNELRYLSVAQTNEALDFVIFLRSRVQKIVLPQVRPLGIMQDKASYNITDDFTITDEELLQL